MGRTPERMISLKKLISLIILVAALISAGFYAAPVFAAEPSITVTVSNGTSANQIQPKFTVTNTGTSAIDLNTLELNYYYTTDGTQGQTFSCDYAGTTGGTLTSITSYVTGEINKLSAAETTATADTALTIGFNGGSLLAGQAMEIHARVWKSDWSNYVEPEKDYSYNNGNKVTAYINDILIWGAAPKVTTPATISPSTGTVDLVAVSDLSINYTLNDAASFTGITGLIINTDYTVSGNTVTMKKNFLETLPKGTKYLTFDMNQGTDPILTITVIDSTPPIVEKVVLAPGSLGTAGNGVITGLDPTKTINVKILSGGNAGKYTNGTGIVSGTAIAITGVSSITGLLNGTTYKVEEYIETHTLTYIAGANGTITGSAIQTVSHGGSGTNVTAVPKKGYRFVKWSDGVTTASRTDSNVISNINVTANFAKNSSSGGSSYTPDKVTVNIKDGMSGNTVSQLEVQRATAADGTKKDTIEYTPDKAIQMAEVLKRVGSDIATIEIPDLNDQVSETNINIPLSAIQIIANGNINLRIITNNAVITMPKESIIDLANAGIGQMNGALYFKVVPIKDENGQKEIEGKINQEEAVLKNILGNNNIKLIGRPMKIETNMGQRLVEITLPLKGVTIPADPEMRASFLNDLAIFIEHSDGEKILTRGEIVEYGNGVWGIKFKVTKFSTFTIVKLNQQGIEGWKNSPEGWKYIKDGQLVTGWKSVKNYWYLMDSAGIMQTGWQKTNGTWYYLYSYGAMATGWINLNGAWYLLDDNGAMLTGWQKRAGRWYYLYSYGAMASNTSIDGWKIGSDGAWIP